MLSVVLLVVLKGVVEASVPSEMASGCGRMAGTALNATSQAKKTVMGASDFDKFPDKSKLPQKTFTWEEVAQYNGENGSSLYLVFDSNVYDVTDFVELHPGGPGPLKQLAGHDASAAMRAAGMPTAVFDVYIHQFLIGSIDKSSAPAE